MEALCDGHDHGYGHALVHFHVHSHGHGHVQGRPGIALCFQIINW